MDLLQITGDPFFSRFSGFPGDEILVFLVRLALDVTTIFILVRYVYRSRLDRNEHQFTLLSMNLVMFLIGYMFKNVEMTMGAAFGLFAVFSMLRYRTENLSARDMTYVFISIAVGLMTSVSGVDWLQVAMVCLIAVTGLSLLERGWFQEREHVLQIEYDRIELIHKEKRMELIRDLIHRTGLEVTRVEIVNLDLLKDSAMLSVYHKKR